MQFIPNARPPNFPDVLDVEVFKYEALQKLINMQKQIMRKNMSCLILLKIIIENYKQKLDFSHYRWTVDTIEDYIFVKEVFDVTQKKLKN